MAEQTQSPGAAFKDSSVDCAICLCPLDSDDSGDSNAQDTITLQCGHRWHLDCIKQQLSHAQPDKSRRILFSGCRCAKCGMFCDHVALRHLTRRTDELRSKVDTLIGEQLSIDAANVWHSATNDAHERKRLIDEGRRTYAFYLCGSCEEPYFGGTVDCADQAQGELPSGEGDRLCPACSPTSQLACRDPVRHRGYHVWKCRYCCQSASHVCYGTVHFCDECHVRNDRRVRELQQQQRRLGAAGSADPPPLDAVPCLGGDSCPHPKPQGQDRHLNGSTCRCEQVYYCAWCRSEPPSRGGGVGVVAPQEAGSRNFLSNPNGEHGLRGWRQLNPQMSWRVEQSEIPVDETVTTNFVSSFQWCVMAQSVPLDQLVIDPSSVRIEVSAKFMARTDCPSVFRMEAVILDSLQREICRKNTAPLVAPADFWDRASLVFEPTERAHAVVMIVCGKDGRSWRGLFGSKVADCSVRILCAEDELERVLTPAEVVRREVVRQDPLDWVRNQPAVARREVVRQDPLDWVRNQPAVARREVVRQDPLDWARNYAYDILLPFALLLFAWLMSASE